jgi:hypothetical protein
MENSILHFGFRRIGFTNLIWCQSWSPEIGSCSVDLTQLIRSRRKMDTESSVRNIVF